MDSKIVRIGNSHGVRPPKAVLQELGLSAGQRVRLEVVDFTIVIRPEHHVRRGWKAAFAKAGAPQREDLWQDIPGQEAWAE